MPAVVVGDERDRRVADLGLARELGLLEVRHPDDVGAPGPVQLRLGERRELRPLHAHVGAALVHAWRRRAGRCRRPPAERAAERVREADVRGQPAAEEGADPPAGPIDELVGHDDVERLHLLLEAADRAGREDEVHAQHLHAEDVGAEVQLGRQQPVPGAVAGQEGDALARGACPGDTARGSPNGVVSVTAAGPSLRPCRTDRCLR